MYKKVIVLEIKEAYVLAMEEGGAVVRIRKKDGLHVGDAIYILEEDLWEEREMAAAVSSSKSTLTNGKVRKKVLKKTVYMRIAGFAAMAAILVLCISFTLPFLSGTVYAQASFDGEACVQVALNDDYEITGAVSPDSSLEDGELNSLVGKPLKEAGEQIRKLCGKGSILIGYAFLEENPLDETFIRELRQLFDGQTILCLSGDPSDVKAADTKVMSLGKYLMEKQNAGADLDDLLESLSSKQLSQLLKEDPSWMQNEDFRDAMLDYQEKKAGSYQSEEKEDGEENETSDDDPSDVDAPDTDDQEDDQEDNREDDREDEDASPSDDTEDDREDDPEEEDEEA